MLNFTVGPVQSCDAVRAIGARDVPYFRTPEFSEVMLENERLLCGLAGAPAGSRAVFQTASSTGAMEAAVMCLLSRGDRAIVVDGGSFGHRFRQMLELHGIPHDAIELEPGTPLSAEHLSGLEGAGHSAFLVNLGETSTGVLYDIDLIGDFCERNGLFLVVDAVSSFLADPLDMAASGIDVMITGSQKALACPPGVSAMVLSPEAIERARAAETSCMYLDVRLLLENGERGQTPFTPAVQTLLQINARLRQIDAKGVDAETSRISALAADFRTRAAGLPFDMRLDSPSNAVTYCETRGWSARELFSRLKDEYGIWICPNGGPAADSSFRVGHLGNLTMRDNSLLLAAMRDLRARGLMGGE